MSSPEFIMEIGSFASTTNDNDKRGRPSHPLASVVIMSASKGVLDVSDK